MPYLFNNTEHFACVVLWFLYSGFDKIADERRLSCSGLAEKEGSTMTDYELLMLLLTIAILVVDVVDATRK